MVFVLISIFLQRFGKVSREERANHLQYPVAKIRWKKGKLPHKRIESALCREQSGQPFTSKMSDSEKRIFPISLGDIKRIPMQIFGGNRQLFELSEHPPSDFGQFRRIVAADIEDVLSCPFRKSIK